MGRFIGTKVLDGKWFEIVFCFVQLEYGILSVIGDYPYLVFIVYHCVGYDTLIVSEFVLLQPLLVGIVLEQSLSDGGEPQVSVLVFCDVTNVGFDGLVVFRTDIEGL